jgi:hypothetical protein
MTKPKSHRKTAKREIRVAKKSSASDAIGKIEKNTDTFILTYGQFSLIDALCVILDQTGPADVSISTWTAADAHLERSAALMESARIKSLKMIIDRSFETRQPKYCRHMRKVFGPECIRAIRTHAKFMLIRSETHNIVVRTSMNLNENPRLENIEISEDSDFADFFQKIVDDVFSEVDENENKSDLPEMENVQETFQFPEIQAGVIKREDLNEPRTTHAIK